MNILVSCGMSIRYVDDDHISLISYASRIGSKYCLPSPLSLFIHCYYEYTGCYFLAELIFLFALLSSRIKWATSLAPRPL